MQRILIVDDEFLVRLGLKTTIDWEKQGYTIVGEASNGKEALDLVKKLLPDIVMTDIKMPVMDGIELISEIQKISDHINIIILSNHENFQFAKQAMKLGVSQYILKSEINEDTLIGILKSIRESNISKNDDRYMKEDPRRTYLIHTVQKASINSCIPLERISRPNESMFCEGPYVIIKYYYDISTMKEKAIDMLLKTMTMLVNEEFPDSVCHSVIYRVHCYTTIIYSVKKHEENWESTFLEKSNTVSRKLKYYFAVQLKGGCSKKGDVSRMPGMFQESEQIRQRCFFEESKFLVYNKATQEKSEGEKRPHVSNTRLSRMIFEKNYRAVKEYIHEIFSDLIQTKNYSYVEHSFVVFLSIAREQMEKMEHGYNTNLIKRLEFDSLYILTTIQDVEKYIQDIFETLLITNDLEKNHYSKSIKQCIEYIESHYSEDLTLEDVAKCAEISKSYLSMLFKQETGINFVNYLNSYRIEEAKRILRTTNLKIYEIAEKVGFYSPYYFSKVFKEVTKMQCKEYKDKFYCGSE